MRVPSQNLDHKIGMVSCLRCGDAWCVFKVSNVVFSGVSHPQIFCCSLVTKFEHINGSRQPQKRWVLDFKRSEVRVCQKLMGEKLTS